MIAALAAAVVWTPIPLRTAEDKRAGRAGGEGAQVVLALASDASGRFLLMGIDVAGIYRSNDGGASWSLATVGYWPRGASCVAIDPGNPKRCLAIGVNSVAQPFHGPWLSTDGAASWRATSLKANLGGNESRDQLAYDPSSFDGSRTRTVYWSRIRDDRPSWGAADVHPAVYRSDDGGETWRELPGSAKAAGGPIRCHPTRKGVVYAGGADGLYRSDDAGERWRKVHDGLVQGLDVSPARPDAVWTDTRDGAFVSNDRGATWAALDMASLVEKGYGLRGLRVSPLDPARMVLWRAQEPGWDARRYASSDGGRTWAQAKVDSSGAFLPGNARGTPFVFSPKDPQRVWSTGGDWPTVSTDGGLTYRYSGTGDNGILVGGMWSFCGMDPDAMFFGSQDYNGAITRDGGDTWRYANVAGNGWGGFVYGGVAVTPTFLVAGVADSWGGKRVLRTSQDGGATWTDTKVALGGADVSFGLPGDPKVAFAHDHRTADGGATWAKMAGCDGVYANGARGESLGASGKAVVRSTDRGRTWTKLADAPDEVRDLAYDPVRRRVYAVLGDRAAFWGGAAWTWLDLPKDQLGSTHARSVAVDPVDPAVVYVAQAANVYSTSAALLRSTDAGGTWTNLTRAEPLRPGERDGGREGLCVRVHPKTREAWVSTSCYGLWKVGPPTNQ